MIYKRTQETEKILKKVYECIDTNGGIATFVTENTDEATKADYPYVAK